MNEEQRAERRTRIGASEVAAVMGVPTFANQNAWTVWADKAGVLEPEKRAAEHLTEGLRLEPLILDWAEHELGEEILRGIVVPDREAEHLAASLDGITCTSRVPVEAKTSGIVGPLHGTWGEALTDEVPDGYLVQCMVQLACTGAELTHLFALLGGRGKVRYQVTRDERMVKLVRQVTEDFWEGWVVTKRDPREGWRDRLRTAHGIDLGVDPCSPPLEIAKRIKRERGITIEADDTITSLVDHWSATRERRLAEEKAEKARLAELIAFLGTAEAAILPDGRLFTYREQKSADTIDREAMKAAGIYDEYARPNTARVPRITKG